MQISIERFVTGPIQTNTYIVSTTNHACIIVDPADGCEDALQWISSHNLKPEAIVLTHGHFDHCMGIPAVMQAYPELPVWMHPDDMQIITRSELNGAFLIGSTYTYTGYVHPLNEGNRQIGSFKCVVLHVPGHTPGGCALVFNEQCLSGDSLFAGSVGRADFALSDGELLITGIKQKLMTLPDTTIVYPGHGGRTTIGRERRLNPFLQE
jgi:glyoxylase-like metal-dependent hydrolase (beta-lactamase superfamily II)